MYSSRRYFMGRGLRIADLIVMCACFAIASYATFHESGNVSFTEFLDMRVAIQNFVAFGLLLALWYAVFSFFDLYLTGRLTRWSQECIKIIMAVSAGTMLIAIVAFGYDIEIVDREFLVVFWLLECSVTIFLRSALRYTMKKVRLAGRNLRYVVIVGSNSRALDIARRIDGDPNLGFRILGFVDDDWSGIDSVAAAGYRIVSSFEEFAAFLHTNVVDEVFICAPLKSLYERSYNLLAQCEEQGVKVHFDENIFTPTRGRIYREEWGGRGWVTIGNGAVRGPTVAVKRAIDIAVSATALIILAPLLIGVAIAIKLTSRGPVFFAQDRVGLNKRIFRMFKFRTMDENAEQAMDELAELNEADGPVFKIKDDPRITSVGKFLRKASIDELPQLVNVFKGDMTLVGPRPLPIRDFEGFSENWYRRRFSVRPGLTCLWQIQGRSGITFERWMELDLEYIDQWSLWLDIRIMLKTIPVVLRGSGAY